MTEPPDIDEFAHCAISKPEDIRDRFVPNFYFGCEAEDSLNALAFNTRINPFGARLNVVLGSDIGHFDVTDMSQILEEAYELVEHGLISEEDLRDLTFTNAVSFFGGVNPNFFCFVSSLVLCIRFRRYCTRFETLSRPTQYSPAITA